MARNKNTSTNDVLILLCRSVTGVLSTATATKLDYSPVAQKIHKTCLKPDIGCFVLFDGGFSGLIVINFTATAAMEIYRTYLLHMGIPEDELSNQHTSDDVSNVLGELMNQIVGDFTGKVARELQTEINQNQPRMLAINKEIVLAINTPLDRPQARRVTFTTEARSTFYLEVAMDKTEFIDLHDYQKEDDVNPDRIIDEANESADAESTAVSSAEQDLLAELGF
ncbi:MAG: DUF3334 family protein [Gammaproteobacteria bacterium]|nr:DUF3334 family protein [Gammaproteobacteria bacterium]